MRSEDKRFQKSFALLSNWHIWRDELTKTSILAAQTTVSVEKGALMRLPGVFPVALQRPLDMFANKAGWIVQPRSERFNHCRRRWSIAQGNGQISEPALMAGAAYGAAFGAFQKGFFIPAKQRSEERRVGKERRCRWRAPPCQTKSVREREAP